MFPINQSLIPSVPQFLSISSLVLRLLSLVLLGRSGKAVGLYAISLLVASQRMPLQSLTLGAASNELRAKNKLPEFVEVSTGPNLIAHCSLQTKINIIS